jgi:hypothetical protein
LDAATDPVDLESSFDGYVDEFGRSDLEESNDGDLQDT